MTAPADASRVAVAMSGGVDSSVTAALLAEQGFDVVGVTLRLWDGPEAGRCCGMDDTADAFEVADRLGIPFHVLDYGDAFRADVVAPFVQEYLHGRTPNPCARCNQHIKFDRLLREARTLGADYLATGHYARLERERGGVRMRTGRDPGKDQSYFLATTAAEDLAGVLFPLGDYTKDRVRELAEGFGLATAGKAESQDICFVPGKAADFVASHGSGPTLEPGPIEDRNGKRLGTHRGAAFYTVGQRRGLGLSADRPLYVVAVDAEANRVIVGGAEEVFSSALAVGEVSWLAGAPSGAAFEAAVKLRYAAPAVPARVIPGEAGARVELAEPVRAVTPGQVAAFYYGDEVLGGGWIAEAA